MKKKKLILIQLNEINFRIFENKIKKFKNFSKLYLLKKRITFSENKYELLEPWIQWVSAYSGKSANEHGVFRLGDYNYANKQIYELLEENKLKIGAISPMNAFNKMKNSLYFFPDPWSKTPSDEKKINKLLSKTISQLVNDNAKNQITFKTFFIFVLCFLYYFRLRNLPLYMKLSLSSFYNKKWNKALFLDLFLSDIHIKNIKKYNPDFTSIFLNAGAHIQHHYFFNMINEYSLNPDWYIKNNLDPSQDLFKVYDRILEEHLKFDQRYDFLISTGLTQIPSKKPKYYYRLRDHVSFLKKYKIKYKEVLPRMTRDFTIIFDNELDAKNGEILFKQFKTIKNENIFGVIDNRGASLFVSFTHSNEIKKEEKFYYGSKEISIYDDMVFVAIKNGIHDQEGYLFTSQSVDCDKSTFHIKEIFSIIKNYFIGKENH